MRSYRKLIIVEFKHGYFPEAILPQGEISIEATPETKIIFDRYRLLLKVKAGILEVIQECEKDEKGIEAVIQIDSPLIFNFIISQSNKNFFNFTQIKYPQMRKEIMFFSNFRNNKIAQNGTLSIKETVSDIDIQGIEIMKADKSKSTSGVIGFLELHTDKFVNKAVETEEAFKYNVSFSERKVYVQYNISEKFNPTKNLQILDEQKNISFKELKTKEQGTEVRLISDKKISLLLIPTDKFKLISANGNKNYTKTLYEKLPVPTIKDIIKHQELENEYIALANVYI